MMDQLLQVVATILASIILMICHELTKAIVYNHMTKPNIQRGKNNIFKLYQYIDPIGLIFCITSNCGFSRPYMYRIKDKKINFCIGLAGFSVLLCLFIGSIVAFRTLYAPDAVIIESDFLLYLIKSFCLISCGMLIVNLFPIATFDMGLIIAGKSPMKYYSILKNDHLIKMILLLTLILGIIPVMGGNIVYLLVTL